MLTSDKDPDAGPEIDGFHLRLYRALDRLEPIVTASPTEETVTRAIRSLYARMERHFAVEEDLAATNSPAAYPRLKADHGELLALLWQMGGVPMADAAARTRLYHQFEAALARHDRDLDGPLFAVTFH